MGKQFGINERKLKLKIPFINIIMIIHKSYHSQYPFYIKFKKENWDSNPKSVLEGLHCVYSIDIAKNGIWYSIDFVNAKYNKK